MKKYIITDPCYIMDDKQYDEICASGCVFELQVFPLKSIHRLTNKPIIFHTIKHTPNGDGGHVYRGEMIGVDAGLLCIAESENGWNDEMFGATFKTLDAAKRAFPKILKHF